MYLDYLEDDLDDMGLVLALKMIELRIYTDICQTEEEIKNEYDTAKMDKATVFLNKIKWFKEWIDMKNLKLSDAGLTEIDEMEIDDILNTLIVTDTLGLKRKKVYDEALNVSIYLADKDEKRKYGYENEDAYNISMNKIFNKLRL
ncbi:MAG: hypothetical protein RRZ84_04905 [Romboutsia sp.]